MTPTQIHQHSLEVGNRIVAAKREAFSRTHPTAEQIHQRSLAAGAA